MSESQIDAQPEKALTDKQKQLFGILVETPNNHGTSHEHEVKNLSL